MAAITHRSRGRLRFFAKTLRRETPQGDTAVSAQNDGRTQFAPTMVIDILHKLKEIFAKRSDRYVDIASIENEFIKTCKAAKKVWEQREQQTEDTSEQQKTSTESGGQYSFKGYSEDGKGKYESNFPKGTPKAAKAERILQYIQNVWSKKPIRLKINENGETRYIEAKFDPTYDESKHEYNDATKLMGGNRHGTASEQRVTLDLADDYYQIASESQYNYSKDETGKDKPTHKDVIKWHYFINDIYFAEYGSKNYEPYRVSINVKERVDGDFVYSFSAEKQRESNTPQTLHAVVNDGNNFIANAQLSNNRVAQNKPSVNNNSTQGDKKYSLSSQTDSDGRQLSEGQQEYFKDSKVRDDNGNLLVMYQGALSDFYEFDRKKSSPYNLYGRGFYFTDSKSHANQYGTAREYYLNIKNPVPTAKEDSTITREQMRKYLEAVAENEDDYDIWNYGTTDIDVILDKVFDGRSDFAMLQDVNATAIGDLVAAIELFNEINGTNFDGIILNTETVTFNSAQAKLVSNSQPTSNPDIRYSLPDNFSELSKMFRDGQLTEEEFRAALEEKEDNNPVSIANLKPEDANTTPPIQPKQGQSKGDKVSNTYGSLMASDIFDDRFKEEVKTDTFVQKYQSVTNKETLRKAADMLDEGGKEFVTSWREKPTDEASLVDVGNYTCNVGRGVVKLLCVSMFHVIFYF